MSGGLRCEEFLQDFEHSPPGERIDPTEFFDKTRPIDRADLVENDLTRFAAESVRHAGGIGPPFRRHRGDEHRADVMVHLVRGNDEAWPGLADLPADGGIEGDTVDFEPTDVAIWPQRGSLASMNVAAAKAGLRDGLSRGTVPTGSSSGDGPRAQALRKRS